ncbi:MAG: OmpH family outer membrane protein [bacterium]
MSKRKIMLVAAVLISSILMNVSVFAQLKIGYIDSQIILNKLPSAVEAQKKLEEQSNVWAEELQKMGDKIRSLQQQLDQQSLLLSEEKKKEKQDEIQQLYMQSQRFQDEKFGQQGELYQKRNELLQPVFDQINEKIQTVAEEEGYDYIFDTVAGNILFAKEGYDLTKRILEELGVNASDL